MCINPTTALLVVQTVSAVVNYRNQVAEQKSRFEQAKRTNELARQNAIQRSSAEVLKIRQIEKESADKGFKATLTAREKMAEAIASAGDSGIAISGSTDRLIGDYYRKLGVYKDSLTQNLQINETQFRRNLEAIQFGQQAQSVYEAPPNPELAFATGALNVANSYYSLEAQKQIRGLQTNEEKRRNRKQVEDFSLS